MTAFRFLLLPAIGLSTALMQGCTSTAPQSTSLSMTSTAGFALPDTITTVPAEPEGDQPAGGMFAAAYASETIAPAAASGSETGAAQTAMLAPAGGAVAAAAPAGGSADSPTDQKPPIALASLTDEDDLVRAAAAAPSSFAGPMPDAPAANASFEPEPAVAALSHPRIDAPDGRLGSGSVEARSPELDALIAKYANYYDVPEELVRRTVKRESTFNPKARNGLYWGLMQISHATAKGMGYRGGASGLLDAETNLKYAVRYLRGAFLVAKGNHALADRLYQRGYYYDAKRAGLLDETGLGKDRRRRRSSS